jgi:sugar O-acyltransferase (sialic acid O-acetyltransferase NeuD family)
MTKVIIFGVRDYAEQAHYYLTKDSPYEVAGFSVTSEYLQATSFCGLPLVGFEDVEKRFPPEDYSFFVPASGRRMNRQREEYYLAAKAKGYSLISYVSSKSVVSHESIGENCFILERCSIQPFGSVGNNCVIWCGVHVGHHTHVGDHVSIITGSTISGRCNIGSYSYISANTVIDANVTLGESTLVSIGTVIKRDTEPDSVYAGNPAQKRRMRSDQVRFL